MEIDKAEKYILDLLNKNLSSTLYYHGLHHTLDVVDQALILADEEGVKSEASLKLLKTAALFHDCGFMNTYKDHEEEGCRIARSELPLFSYTNEEIDQICGMIMATKIPQSPKNQLEKILCDADLDYLGRNDFEPIAASLFEELKSRQIIENEKTWNFVQVKFLESHHYHTNSARSKRAESKQKRLEELRKLI
ncbi:HD domain-containing protein [Dyadobacter sp. CY345]|uniref:HD domain-containing protein n=1 Tax=Dyadobacter sp. CY345 TaxID=2909335 RepID=UPI001F4149F7|nr:HD domain-containing protein [Dyadobacter sp. CY345]MCF2446445.1 HD domain-containing protein [Dyadobacter sp. CY345]